MFLRSVLSFIKRYFNRQFATPGMQLDLKTLSASPCPMCTEFLVPLNSRTLHAIQMSSLRTPSGQYYPCDKGISHEAGLQISKVADDRTGFPIGSILDIKVLRHLNIVDPEWFAGRKSWLSVQNLRSARLHARLCFPTVLQRSLRELGKPEGLTIRSASSAIIGLIGILNIAFMTMGGPVVLLWARSYSPQLVVSTGGSLFTVALILASFGR